MLALPSLKFLVTPRCNIRCLFCHNEFQGNGSARIPQLFDRTATRALLETISPTKHFSDLKISGGEPLTEFGTLTGILEIVSDYTFERRIVVTNLLLATRDKLSILRDLGIIELRVNLPAFDSEEYGRMTGTSPSSFGKLRRRLRLARQSGLRVRANIVVSDRSITYMERVLNNGAGSGITEDLDELFFIVDVRSRRGDEIAAKMQSILEMHASRCHQVRKGRITEFLVGATRLSVAHCTVLHGPYDYYIRAPGEVVTEYVPGFAYK